MNKLKIKHSGKEVKMGDKLVKVVTINETTLPDLIKQGIIVEESSISDITIDSVIQHLADKIGWNRENLEKYFDNPYKISPAAVFEIVLKEVAILLDEKYPDHIRNSKEIWVINKVNGEIHRLKYLNKIKSFKHFAAFRSLEDALVAEKVMAPALKDLYGKQKN